MNRALGLRFQDERDGFLQLRYDLANPQIDEDMDARIEMAA